MPEVSVIIPIYNSATYVIDAVESLVAQTYQDFEIVVIDDGSANETAQVMQRYKSPVHYIRQTNSGVAVARNRGITESCGKYVAFLDADDTWWPHKLERQMTAIQQQPAYRACYAAFTVVDAHLNPLRLAGVIGKEQL